METMKLWDSVCETNPDSTKQVDDGRRRFTAIDAYAQIRKATELWGPYGGKWRLSDIRLTPGPTDQLCYLTAMFTYPDGSFQVINAIKHTSNKGIVDADCLKKLETDTLTKALSKLGFNADVFLGLFDDNRYVQEQRAKQRQQEQQPDPKANPLFDQASQLLVDKQQSLSQEQKDWCSAQIASNNPEAVIKALKDL